MQIVKELCARTYIHTQSGTLCVHHQHVRFQWLSLSNIKSSSCHAMYEGTEVHLTFNATELSQTRFDFLARACVWSVLGCLLECDPGTTRLLGRDCLTLSMWVISNYDVGRCLCIRCMNCWDLACLRHMRACMTIPGADVCLRTFPCTCLSIDTFSQKRSSALA